MEHPLKTARKAKGLRQKELAALASIDASVVCRIEKGFRARLSTFRALGAALGCDYRDLLPADEGDPQ